MKSIKSTVLLTYIISIGGIVIFFNRSIFYAINYISKTEYGSEILIFVLFASGVVSAKFTYQFLQDNENSTSVGKVIDIATRIFPLNIIAKAKGQYNSEIYEHIDEELRKHSSILKDYIDNIIIPENINASFKKLYKEKLSELATNDIITLAEEKYSINSLKISFQKGIDADRLLSSQRLESQINTTNRSASINLIVGSFTTIAAVSILYITIVQVNTHEVHNIQDFIAYIPRITLSIFIEIFSFFFLRLYRKNLDDIKYLYNERTNIELKFLAHKTALYKDDTELIKIIVDEFSKTERNFILKQGETTVDSERIRIESAERSKIIEAASLIFKKSTDGK